MISISCKSSEFVSFIIALVNVGVAPKFAFKVFHLCVDDSSFEGARSMVGDKPQGCDRVDFTGDS